MCGCFVCFFKVKYLQLALIIPKISLFPFHKDVHIRNPELTNISCVSMSDQGSLGLNGLKNGISNRAIRTEYANYSPSS